MKDTYLSLKQIRERRNPNLAIGFVELPYVKLSDSLVNRLKHRLFKQHVKELTIVDCNEFNESE